ncbi:uncharacterized protein LOC132943275 [Metopolophium dirhodum]|uniref:uncharacterized protein LOC132943275 n=1 Tax=Metopolophium dirhodum TaxID=44670 RepID=UPI0029903BB0|nr:uncharacterized protein LOC132943275 [Metopolophium dirhodum]
MNRLQATTVLLVASVTAVAADVATTAGLGQASPPPSDWFRGCGAADWPQCVAQNVARTFRLLEQSDRLQIADGVRLVKTTATTDRSAKYGNHTFDLINRVVSFVDSHSLQIDLWTPDNNVTTEGRRRHAYRRVFPIIVGTYMIMSAVLIPMGFMFMSTLGGKALLVSKMALMVSLMSNIKKIFSYEYYVPPAPAAGHHHWKRTLLAHRTTAGPLYSSYTAY